MKLVFNLSTKEWTRGNLERRVQEISGHGNRCKSYKVASEIWRSSVELATLERAGGERSEMKMGIHEEPKASLLPGPFRAASVCGEVPGGWLAPLPFSTPQCTGKSLSSMIVTTSLRYANTHTQLSAAPLKFIPNLFTARPHWASRLLIIA